jgi:hypothetical protein
MAYEMCLTGYKADGSNRLILLDARDIWRIKTYWDHYISRVYVKGYPSFDVKETPGEIIRQLKDMGVDVDQIYMAEGAFVTEENSEEL